MIQLKYAIFGVGLAFVFSTVSIPAYAYYHEETAARQNAFSVSEVVRIHFSENGGSGSMEETSIALGHGHTIPVNTMKKEGYSFGGWNTAANGSGTALADGDSVDKLLPGGTGGSGTGSSGTGNTETEITLYAQWTINQYTVSYDANGGSGTAIPDMVCSYDTDYTAEANSFVYDDHLFLCWNTKADGSGQTIQSGSIFRNLNGGSGNAVTLYAQWEDESADVIETEWNRLANTDGNGNGVPDRQEVGSGSFVRKDPSLKNHSDKEVYGYLFVDVPAVSAKVGTDQTENLYNIAELNVTDHWTLVNSEAATGSSGKSHYLYRYDTTLKPNGTAEKNPYQSYRAADRSTDLMTGFTIREFSSCSEVSTSIDVRAVFAEAAVTQAEADSMALAALKDAGYW